MRSLYEHLILGIAALFIAVLALHGCAAWTPEMSTCAKEQALCVSLCSVNTVVSEDIRTAPDAVRVAAECMAKCLSE